MIIVTSINPSSRPVPDKSTWRVERPEGGPQGKRSESSSAVNGLDAGLRRHDGNNTNQKLLKRFVSLLALCLVLGASPVHAGVTLEAFKFDTPAEELHFKKLIEELRCLVCQNQSLADSDAELAHDLRAEVYTMVQDGKTDAEIIDFLVARYGDFVLYNPPVKPSNYLIWFGPFVLLIIAAYVLLRAVRRQKITPAPEITPAERARLDAILDAAPPEKDKQQ